MDYIGTNSGTVSGRFAYSLLSKLRYLIIALRSNNRFISQLMAALKYNKVDLVVDVGAGEGEFALELMRAGYKGKIISIEPLSSAYKILKSASRKHKKWVVLPRIAVGDYVHSDYINISQNSVSSSILDMLPSHLNAAPDSKYVRKERVEVRKLDSFLDKFRGGNSILLKIDAQGYESYILGGAKKLLRLKNLKGLLIEVSFSQLYKGQKTFDYFYGVMKEKGFAVWGIERVLIEKSTGKLLQINLLAFRESAPI